MMLSVRKFLRMARSAFQKRASCPRAYLRPSQHVLQSRTRRSREQGYILKSLGLNEKEAGIGIGQLPFSLEKAVSLEVLSPCDGSPIGQIQTCQLSDYERLMQEAEKAALAWRLWPAPKRGEIIRQIGLALRRHKDALGMLVSWEMGKSRQEGEGEVQEMIDMADMAVGQSRMLYGSTMHSERPQHRMYEQWHPYGIVGVISAFNFPVAVWSWNAFLSAICGNVTIWKPSSKTPFCAAAVHRICQTVLNDNQAPAIFGFFVPQTREISEYFLQDKRVPLISFTGSTQTGRHVAETVARRLGKTILELGGNNAIIVDETADLNLAIPAIVFGAVGTAGQRCTTTRRLFLQETIAQSVIERLKGAYQQIKIGNPLEPQHLMGPLIDAKAVSLYSETLKEIQQAGGQIVFGGKVLNKPGCYVEPVLVTGLSHDSPIIQRETFAPILYIMPYKTLPEAIAMQNAVPQGLSSALFTQSLKASELFLGCQGSDCGIANINVGTSGAEIGGAFGGEKETGGGREAGSDAWKAYMRRQTNTINWGNTLPLAQGIRFEAQMSRIEDTP